MSKPKVAVETHRIFHLSLPEEQAKWLRDYLQNAFEDTPESFRDRNNREGIFYALKNSLDDPDGTPDPIPDNDQF